MKFLRRSLCSTLLFLSIIIAPGLALASSPKGRARLAFAGLVQPRRESCETLGFEGQEDLYGAGIRFGVYFQWVSSWLIRILNPGGSAATHADNATFVLAVTAGLVFGATHGEMNPVEVYVMMLICFGYFFTVLSILGVRIHFATPTSLAAYVGAVVPDGEQPGRVMRRKLLANFMVSLSPLKLARSLVATLLLRGVRDNYSLSSASKIKHPVVSWVGIVWRSGILSLIAGFSTWYWFTGFFKRDTTDDELACQRYVLFGSKVFNAENVLVFKVLSVVVAVPAFYVLYFAYPAFTGLIHLIFRVRPTGYVSPVDPHRARKGGAEPWTQLLWPQNIFLVLVDIGLIIAKVIGIILSPFHYYRNIKYFTNFQPFVENQWVSLSDVMGAFLLFLSQDEEYEESEEMKKEAHADMRMVVIYFAFHALTLTTMACFIIFIEMTLSVNKVTDVYKLDTTGQLIPFITGLVSLLGAIADLLIICTRKHFPQWDAMDIVMIPGMTKIVIYNRGKLVDEDNGNSGELSTIDEAYSDQHMQTPSGTWG